MQTHLADGRLIRVLDGLVPALLGLSPLFAWEFEKRGREVKVRVDGQLVFTNLALRLQAALAGLGLTYVPEDVAQEHRQPPASAGSKIGARPSRAIISTIRPAGSPPAFAVLVEALAAGRKAITGRRGERWATRRTSSAKTQRSSA